MEAFLTHFDTISLLGSVRGCFSTQYSKELLPITELGLRAGAVISRVSVVVSFGFYAILLLIISYHPPFLPVTS